MKLAQPWRVTTIAPQALPSRAALYQSQPWTKPYSAPAAKASPAPRMLATSTGKPGASIRVDLARSVRRPDGRARPSAPRFCSSTFGPSASSASIAASTSPLHARVGDLRVGQADLAGVGQHGGVDLVLGADHDIDQAQRRAQRDAKGARVVPLVGPEVDVERHRHAGLAGQLGGEQRGAAARLLAQAGAADQQRAAVGDRRRQHVVDRQLDVGAVVAVVGQREAVGRLDPQHAPRWSAGRACAG